MSILFALGCSFGLTAITQEPRSGVPEITAVTPTSGPPTGGTEVTISGARFLGDVHVTFDGEPAEVTVVDPSTLVVVTPRLGEERTVDVTVESTNGTDTLEGGFTFRRPDEDSGSDSGEDTDRDHTGEVGGYLAFEWSDLACPVCTGLPSTEPPSVRASALLHRPTAGSWWSWLPADGACVADAGPTALSSATLDAGSTIVLNDGTQDVVLSSTSAGGEITYTSGALATSVWAADGLWDAAARGGDGVDAFRLDDILVTPADFTYIQPGSILADTTQGAWTAPFSASAGTTVTWAPYNVGDLVLVTLTASSGGSATCRSEDDGTLLIPASTFTGWSNGAQLTVRIARYTFGQAVLPDGSTLETVGSIERVGTGYVRY